MKKFAFTLAAALLTSPAFAQIEVGAGIGASIFTGDLGGSQYNYAFNPMDIDVMSTRLAGQAFVRVPPCFTSLPSSREAQQRIAGVVIISSKRRSRGRLNKIDRGESRAASAPRTY